MKLRGSPTEQEFRTQLIKSNQSLFSPDRKLLEVIKKCYPEMITAYILDWIPEQGEEFYTILVNDNIITRIEIDHDDIVEPIVESITMAQYLHGLRKQDQIQLAVALDLVEKDMKNYK